MAPMEGGGPPICIPIWRGRGTCPRARIKVITFWGW